MPEGAGREGIRDFPDDPAPLRVAPSVSRTVRRRSAIAGTSGAGASIGFEEGDVVMGDGMFPEFQLADQIQQAKAPYMLGSFNAVVGPDVQAVPVISTLDGEMPEQTRIGRRRRTDSVFRVIDETAVGALGALVTDTVAPMSAETFGLELFDTPNRDDADRLKIDAVDTLLTLLSVGAKATPDTDATGGIAVDAALRVAFGAELLARTARGVILGRDVPDIPEDLLQRFGDLEQVGCFQTIQNAATAYANARDAATPRPVGVIQKLDPVDACPGTKLSITGAGFGTSGMVAFTTASGVVLVAATKWQDDLVEVLVPSNAVPGPIGLYPPTDSQVTESLGAAGGELLDVLGHCFGPAVQARLDGARNTLSTPPVLVTTGAFFEGGVPLIRSFLVDGHPSLVGRPGQTITLSWEIRGATSVTVTGTGAAPAPTTAATIDAFGRGSVRIKLPARHLGRRLHARGNEQVRHQRPGERLGVGQGNDRLRAQRRGRPWRLPARRAALPGRPRHQT